MFGNARRYEVQHSTNSTGAFTELFDRKLGTASRLADHWPRETMIAWVEHCRANQRNRKD